MSGHIVEQEISEQILFFSLNHPSSSIVVKVDFDLTISLLAHNLYKIFTSQLRGFENCFVPKIHREFVETGAKITIDSKQIHVELKKKSHLPILLETSDVKSETYLSWHGRFINFSIGAST